MKKGTGESEDEFVVNEGDDVNDNGEKEDSDSGNVLMSYFALFCFYMYHYFYLSK